MLKKQLHETKKQINHQNSSFEDQYMGQNFQNESINQSSVPNGIIYNQNDIHFLEFSMKIIDQGQGISQEGLNKLFLNFQSLQEHRDVNQRGTGLGLSICKQLIQKMGGHVTVESLVGKGTTFIIKMTTIYQPKQDITTSALSGTRTRNDSKEFLRQKFSDTQLHQFNRQNTPMKKMSKRFKVDASESSNDDSLVTSDLSSDSIDLGQGVKRKVNGAD